MHLLEEAIEHMHHGFCVFDADGRVVACNSRYGEVLDLPPGEVQPGITASRLIELSLEAGICPPGTSSEEQAAAMWANLTCSDLERQTIRRGDRVLASFPRRTPDGHLVATLADVTKRAESQDALQASQARLSAILDAIPDSVKIYAEDGTLTYINPQGLEQVEATSMEQLVAAKQAIIVPEYRAASVEVHKRVIAGETIKGTYEVSGLRGGRLHVEATAVPFRMPDGSRAHMCISRDVTARHQAETALRLSEERLRESEERFRLAAEAATLGVWDYDPITRKRKWSSRLCEIFGLAGNVEPSLEFAAERVHPDERNAFLDLLHDMRDNPETTRFTFTFRIYRANDGAERWLTMNGWKADSADALKRIVLTVRDVTEERTAGERIRWNASHDGLTQLANRVSFQEQLDNAVHRAKRADAHFGLLMIDLDHFKQINDALGHQAGDRLLQSFADRLRATVRPSDTVARLGGDEFAILVGDIDSPDRLADLSRSIHERLREPFIQKGRVLDCRVSIGAAVYPQHGTTPKDLMVSADMALYAAKAEGRSTTIEYRPQLRDEVQRFAAMVGTAREAIHDDRIVPYYQPKLDLRDGSIIGFEALLRWHDKTADSVHLPASIAAAFDDHEVAAEISERIISQSIAAMRRWIEKDVPFGHVAVNASAAEFRRDDFAERVLGALHKSDIPACCFQLEVTETVFLGRGAEFVQRALQVLSKAGVRIALDDFGTGYASLRHLKEFPVDTVKIDRSFVRDMQVDPNDEAIIRAVVNLGKNLGISVVAEGIEHMSQAERLIELGCDFGQGFLFSEAVPGNRVAALVESFAKRPPYPRGREPIAESA